MGVNKNGKRFNPEEELRALLHELKWSHRAGDVLEQAQAFYEQHLDDDTDFDPSFIVKSLMTREKRTSRATVRRVIADLIPIQQAKVVQDFLRQIQIFRAKEEFEPSPSFSVAP